jgi:hypothetical protein
MSKQSFRPGAIDPIKHNEMVATNKAIKRLGAACRVAARSMRHFGAAVNKLAAAAQKLRWATE